MSPKTTLSVQTQLWKCQSLLIEAFNFHHKNTKKCLELYSESSKTSAIWKSKLLLQEKWRHRFVSQDVSSSMLFCAHSLKSSLPPYFHIDFSFSLLPSSHLYLPSCSSTHPWYTSHLTHPVWHMCMCFLPLFFQHQCGLRYFFYHYMYVYAYALSLYFYEYIIL